MEADPVLLIAEVYSFIGIVLAAFIFTRLAIKARSIGNFRFQLSIFILIWVAAEIPHVLDSLGLIDLSSYLTIGLMLHLVSMIMFAVFVGLRSLRFLHPPHGARPFFPETSLTGPLKGPSPPRNPKGAVD
ncbi:hypothetical protein E6H23_01515 [Candidatus Bathyarchaeota archaeon]|nr:MAG: hypothetical protein E6H23_01515 [Candidatus Bathyarchaeota archaeon]